MHTAIGFPPEFANFATLEPRGVSRRSRIQCSALRNRDFDSTMAHGRARLPQHPGQGVAIWISEQFSPEGRRRRVGGLFAAPGYACCSGRARRARNYVHGRRTTEDTDHFTRGLRTSHAKEKRTKRNKANRPTNTVARMVISRPSNRREISSSHNRMATQSWPDRIGKWCNRRIGVPGSIAAGCGHAASCGYAWIRRQSLLPVSI
jgi:hypothetical protein